MFYDWSKLKKHKCFFVLIFCLFFRKQRQERWTVHGKAQLRYLCSRLRGSITPTTKNAISTLAPFSSILVYGALGVVQVFV